MPGEFLCNNGGLWTRTRPLRVIGTEDRTGKRSFSPLVMHRPQAVDGHGRTINMSLHGFHGHDLIANGAFEFGPYNAGVEVATLVNIVVDADIRVARACWSTVDLWNIGVPHGPTLTGGHIVSMGLYGGGDAVGFLFVGEVTDQKINVATAGTGPARFQFHTVPSYAWKQWSPADKPVKPDAWSEGKPKRVTFDDTRMSEGTYTTGLVYSIQQPGLAFAAGIKTVEGPIYKPIQRVQVLGSLSTGGGPSGGGTDEPDGPPPPPPTSLSSFVPAPEFPARDVSTAARQDWTGRTPSIGYFPIALSGTAAAPVVMNFANADGSRQRVPHKFYVTGSYAVINGLDAHKIEIGPGSHHIVLQNCRAGGDATRKGAGFAIAGSGAAPVSQIVLSACEASSNGDWLAEFDEDFHGLAIGGHVAHVWVTGSLFYHNSGDAIQINAGSLASQDGLHHIYVVGNEMRECKQTGGAVKQARNVVFAANHVHHMKPIGRSPSAWGAGVGHQYGAGPVWFIANHIHDCSFGIQSGSTSGLGDGQDAYYLFNVIHDIRHDATIDPDTGKLKYAYNPNTAWSNAGFSLVGNPNKYVIGNTIINADGGIYFVGGVRLLAEGNIIAGNSNQDVWLEDPNGATLEVYSNLAWPSAELRIANQAQAWPIGNLVGDPKFVVSASSRFVPGPGSPAIAAWTPSISARSVFQRYRDTFGVSIEVDATGRARPQGAWTIGAFQP